ncbi:MAG: glycosyltransferase [Desulfurococcaceae archaeon]|nr:glycosyltransferase [Desulfurococcaceae archaeon]
MNNVDILFICSHLGKIEAAYRRIEYFIKYLRARGMRVACIGVTNITRHGIAKSSEECYSVPLVISSRSLAVLLINFLLSFSLILLILIIRPKVIIISIPDSYLILASYIGGVLVRSKIFIDIRDPQEEIMSFTYRKGLSGFIAKVYKYINYSIYRRARVIIGVTRTLVNTLIRKLYKPVYLIPNGADLNVFEPLNKKEVRQRLGLNQGSLLIGYIGGLSSYGYYNILPVLIAIRKIGRELGVDIKFVAAGPILNDGIKRIIDYFTDEFIYMGVIDTNGVVTLLSACDIGVIPRIGDPVYNYAVPVKFYEYIAVGLPVIAIANKRSELAEIVEKNKLGIVCEPQDYACIEKAIKALAINKNLLDEFRKNVLTFRKYIDRRIGAERLFKLISRLVQADKLGA